MMGGLNIKIGISLSTFPLKVHRGGSSEFPSYLSCFGTGIWENEGYWINENVWKFQSQNPPFLRTGIWNNEGRYRFKDNFMFGMSFLPTGIFRFGDIFRFEDKIKIEGTEAPKKDASKKNDRNYWNF